uniref:GATOR complex protein NPRL2-like isoform X1 n=1 Tax=Styela clava TaxID=7725 RepID=UPI001939882F|nr:GATOR complex protein NPRL2-like isoform X1 [Styela clava]
MNDSLQSYIAQHPIECMFFSEFHHLQGPKITYQYPDGYFNQQEGLFEEVTNYIIPKPELQEKLTTVNVGKKKVIGCPVCIEGSHYPRNNFIFNFGLVLDSNHKSSPCIPMIKQLSKYMSELEKENGFVSNEETREMIPNILRDMLEELNTKGSCCTRVNDNTTLFLKVFPPTTLPPVVKDHDVPILMVSIDEFMPGGWDLTTERILPFIDGFRHVQKIAYLADVDPRLTRTCIRDLAFYRIVELISIFQYSNTYVTTSNLSRLMSDKALQTECIQYVSRPGHPKPTLNDILAISCGLTPGVTVDNLCSRHQKELNKVNEQKLIQFGLINKLIRRIHVYPVKTSKSECIEEEFHRYCTGEFSTDEICCKTGLSFRELSSRIDQDPCISVCMK